MLLTVQLYYTAGTSKPSITTTNTGILTPVQPLSPSIHGDASMSPTEHPLASTDGNKIKPKGVGRVDVSTLDRYSIVIGIVATTTILLLCGLIFILWLR